MPSLLRTAIIVAGLALAACSSEETGPYFDVQGGGFIFNYRIAEATAGVVVFPKRTFPAGGRLEATFPNPAGGEPFLMIEKVEPDQKKYDFTTPPLQGVRKDVDYPMVVRLLDVAGNEVAKVEKVLRSELDQTVLPSQPLTIGPGYARNPAAAPPATVQ